MRTAVETTTTTMKNTHVDSGREVPIDQVVQNVALHRRAAPSRRVDHVDEHALDKPICPARVTMNDGSFR